MPEFKGFIPAAYTPFQADYTLDLDAVEKMASWYRKQGIDTVFICGTTGEFSSLTTPERRLLADAWFEAAADDLSIWVHVGHTCQRDAMGLAQHAQAAGAGALSALAPYYFKPQSAGQLVDFLAPIAASAPELPFYYYHIPSLSGIHLDVAELVVAAFERIPNFAGLKYSSMDLYALQAVYLDAGLLSPAGLDVFFGVDEMLLAALPLGIRGAIGSTYNLAAPLYKTLLARYNDGDLDGARELQQQSVALVRLFDQYGGISTGKALMSRFGAGCGPPRPPLKSMTAAELEALFVQVDTLTHFISSLPA